MTVGKSLHFDLATRESGRGSSGGRGPRGATLKFISPVSRSSTQLTLGGKITSSLHHQEAHITLYTIPMGCISQPIVTSTVAIYYKLCNDDVMMM